MKNEIIPYDAIRKNPWNPNVMVARVYDAELESILEFGFIDPPTLRENAHGENQGFEIIDGEHRWKGFAELRAKWLEGEPALESYGIKVTWSDGTQHPLHEDLVPLFEKNEIPVTNLGLVTDANAKKLTLILNETRGRSNTVDVAALLAEIAAETGGQGLGQGLPYSDPEIEEMLRLVEYDWNAVASTPQSSGGAPDSDGDDPEGFIPLQLLISEAGNGVLTEAFAKMKAKLAQDDISLHENPKMALGEVVERLAARFLEN